MPGRAVHPSCRVLHSALIAPARLGLKEPKQAWSKLRPTGMWSLAVQLWAGVLPFGPKGRCLNGSFAQASSLAFQEEVGDALLQLCEVVPGGVLVFFGSFHLMNTLINRWKGTGILPKIAALKTVFEGEAVHAYTGLYCHHVHVSFSWC